MRKAAIVGIAEFPERRVQDDISALNIKASSAQRALEDAGLGWGDVDALYDAGEAFSGMSPVMMAEYLQVNPRVRDRRYCRRGKFVRVSCGACPPRHRGGSSPCGSSHLWVDGQARPAGDWHRRADDPRDADA